MVFLEENFLPKSGVRGDVIVIIIFGFHSSSTVTTPTGWCPELWHRLALYRMTRWVKITMEAMSRLYLCRWCNIDGSLWNLYRNMQSYFYHILNWTRNNTSCMSVYHIAISVIRHMSSCRKKFLSALYRSALSELSPFPDPDVTIIKSSWTCCLLMSGCPTWYHCLTAPDCVEHMLT